MSSSMQQSPSEKRQMSGKLKQMKFMQRSEDRAREDAEKKVEKKRIDESHWRAVYADSEDTGSKPAVRVVYEPSHLRMPTGDTAVRADGTPSSGGGSGGSSSGSAYGRRSFRSFNAQVEEAGREAEQQQRDESEARMSISEESMAAAMSKRAQNGGPDAPKRKRL
ncbi:hypothetical protein GGF46_005264 [Coemansia sp. RSA 552]|nr:hypothetical protein GGF46_005264 [Coemansia sp. RSA 552]